MARDTEALGSRALDAFARGRFEDVARIAHELGAGHFALVVHGKARMAELRFAEHGDIDEPAGPFMSPVCVRVPFSMLREHFPGEPALLEALVRLKADLDPAARVVPVLTDSERKALRALSTSKVPLPSAILQSAKVGLTKRALADLATRGLVEACGSGKSKRGVYRLTAEGARIAALLG